MSVLQHLSGVSYLGLAVAGIGIFKIREYRTRKPLSTRGSAHWLPISKAAATGLFRPKGFLVGDWNSWSTLPVFYNNPVGILCVGSPGTWKGTGVLMADALRTPFHFILDPGGEISAVCIKEWRSKGYRVDIINPWDMHPEVLSSAGFEPLIESLDRKSPAFSSDALKFARLIVDRSSPAAGTEDHWDKKGFGALQALIMHVRLKGLGLVELRKLIAGDEKSWANLISEMRSSENPTVQALGNEMGLKQTAGPGEFSGIISTMEAATKWLDDEAIRDCLSRSGVRLKNLKGWDEAGKPLKGAIVAVVIPSDYVASHAAFIRLMIGAGISVMSQGKKSRKHVRMTIDEFGTLGKVDAALLAPALMRKYRMSFNFVVHNIGQMKHLYGDAGWTVLAGTCRLKLFLSTNDEATKAYVSKACGTATVVELTPGSKEGEPRVSYIPRPLIMPEEVEQLPENQMIMLRDNLPPAKITIKPYFRRVTLAGKFNSNPHYDGPRKGPPITWPVRVILGIILRLFGGSGVYVLLLSIAAMAVFKGWR